MTWIATAIIGGAVISTIGSSIAAGNASSAATQAANVQADAANNAAAIQAAMYSQTRNDLLPFQNTGRAAIPYANSLVPGGLSTSNAAQPSSVNLGGGAGSPGGQLSGYDENGNPVYTSPSGGASSSPAGTTGSFSGATGGAPADGSQPSGNNPISINAQAPAGGSPAPGQSPFLTAQLNNVPQLTNSQANLDTLAPGTGTNPLQSSLYSYVNGSSSTPNPLLSATNNAVLGGSATPNAALNNLTSYIPGAANANPALGQAQTSLQAYGALLGLNPSPMATSQLQSINDQYNVQRTDWLAANPGKTDADWAKTDQAKDANQQLIGFYQNNPDMVASGINQAKSQVSDPDFGSAAQDRLDALQKITPQTTQQAEASALAQTPGYQFALNQGLEATQNGFAAQGLASSGAALKGAAQYSEGLASQTYNQQLQNYLGNYSANLNNYNSQTANANNTYNATSNNALNNFTNQSGLALNSYGQAFTNALNTYGQQANIANTGYTGQTANAQNLLNLGANAATQTGNVGQNTANNAGGYLTSGAAAAAGGIVGSTNAINNGLIAGTNNLGGTATLYGLNPGLFNSNSAGSSLTLGGLGLPSSVSPIAGAA